MGKNRSYCKINGVIYNLSKIQDIIDGKSNECIDVVLFHEYGIDITTAMNFDWVLEFCGNEIPADYNEAFEKMRAYNEARHSQRESNILACPRCGSTNVKVPFISYYNHKCGNCRYEWTNCPKCGTPNVDVRVYEVDASAGLYDVQYTCTNCKNKWR